MDEKKQIFKEYIDNYKTLDVNSKRNELIEAIKEMIVIFDNLSANDNINLEYLKSNEILDINKTDYSEDDFLEAAMVYLEIAKDIIGQYLIQKENIMNFQMESNE
ncbi:MAG: hypothetical protein IJA94_03145 [Bacilli bacterium]|nr:hypothetical protein [Bacilli bacterium]